MRSNDLADGRAMKTAKVAQGFHRVAIIKKGS